MALTLCCAVLLAGAAHAQGYRLRLDTRVQAASYRGVVLDSIPATDTVAGPGGGPVSPDGFAVRCAGADPYCSFFRPGPVRRGGPLTTLADLSVWGWGLTGLSLHVTARAGADLGSSPVWPGTEPALQLLEGYAQYARDHWSARLGRQTAGSRLGLSAFDGARATVRHAPAGLEAGGFVGWGLDRGSPLPVTSPTLNPLDDFRPQSRQIVAGLGAGWSSAALDVRMDYLREVDPRSDYFVSERVGMEAVGRPVAALSIRAGATYDMAAGWWGTAEASLAYAGPRANAAVGVRRYRPHFDLWTIWGAFSPVPYHSVHGRVAVQVLPVVRVRVRGERYAFDDADVVTPLVDAESNGWRWELGATVTARHRWSFDAGYHAEFGPGAASAGPALGVTYAQENGLRVTAHAASLERPLEFRYSTASLTVYGIDAEVAPAARVRIALGATGCAEQRERPDPASFDWDQVRVTARVSLEFGGGGDGRALPPAIRRLPGGRSRR